MGNEIQEQIQIKTIKRLVKIESGLFIKHIKDIAEAMGDEFQKQIQEIKKDLFFKKQLLDSLIKLWFFDFSYFFNPNHFSHPNCFKYFSLDIFDDLMEPLFEMYKEKDKILTKEQLWKKIMGEKTDQDKDKLAKTVLSIMKKEVEKKIEVERKKCMITKNKDLLSKSNYTRIQYFLKYILNETQNPKIKK